MKMDARMSFDALHTSGKFAVDQGHLRRFGSTQQHSLRVTGISVESSDGESPEARAVTNKVAKLNTTKGGPVIRLASKKKDSIQSVDKDSKHEENAESSAGSDSEGDGFIAM